MNYVILSGHLSHQDLPEGDLFFTTDRTIGRDPSLLCPLLGADGFARPHQVHGSEVVIIEPSQQPEADAVMTDMPGLCTGVSTADCIPVLVFDPEHHVAAAIHAGWRGTLQRIVSKTIRRMTEIYGTDAANCEAVVGPGISLDSFEVGNEVYDAFADEGFDMARFARKDEKWHIDLKEINRCQLVGCGVPEGNIIVSLVDTFTDTDFFSARREQKGDVKCGRIFTGFVLR